MKAYVLHAYQGPGSLVLEEVADPNPGDSAVLVQVAAIGINFPDLLITQVRYQVRPELPFTPGCEIAGIVRAAPPGFGRKRGDRVAAFQYQRRFAELAVVPPTSWSAEEAR